MSSRSLVVGIDGTGCSFDDQSNVANIIRVVRRVPSVEAIYVKGLGSDKNNRVRGGVFVRGINRQVRRTYQRIAEIYEPGDRLFGFGFSRGGAMMISVANLIGAVGLSRAAGTSKGARDAMSVYGAREGLAGVRRLQFRAKYDTDLPTVTMLGLFDPVGSVGIHLYHRLARLQYGQHDLDLHGHVEHYVAVLAENEHRTLFQPVTQTGHYRGQTVEQIWMPGCHGDVGGGNGQSYARYALGIMIERAAQAGLPLDDIARAQVRDLSSSYLIGTPTNSWRGPHRAFGRVNRLTTAPIAGRKQVEVSSGKIAA